MAAMRSFGSVALLTFYAFTFLFLTRGPIQNRSKCLLRRPLGLFSTRTVFSSEAGLIFVVKLGGKFKLDLRSKSYFKSSFPVTKWTKHGSTLLHIPGHDPPLDITVFSDVSRNPGTQVLHFEPTTRTHADLHTVSSRPKISYSRSELFKIRRVSNCSLSGRIFADLNLAGLLHLRGCRAGRRDFIRGIKVIASNRIEVEGTRYALEHAAGVNRNNLISIPHAPQQLNHEQRQQPLKFFLLNVRSIRKKTLLLRDYIVEHDIDLLAITETWLTDDSSDEFYCRDICPEGYKIEQLPRNYADGGGVALVYRRCFKVKKDVQTIHRSFKLINIHITSACNHNLKLVVIYRAPPSLENGFTVRMSFEEFSSFLEGLGLTTSALLVAGDFNFHIDEPNDCDARRFLQVLESFDLIQHVSEVTHKNGHILDLIITRSHEKLVGRCTVDNPFVSDHLAVHSLLDLAKIPLERKRISYRKIRDIDFSEFCGQLEDTRLVRDAASFSLGELVYEYNTTLKSLLDSHAPLKNKTITLRPTALWYTEELRSEMKKPRALERCWRSSKRECDYSRFKEQCLRVNALIKKTKVDYYSGIIQESSNNPRTLFSTVNKLLHKGVPTEYPSGCASDGDLANKFIDFFGEKITVLRNSLDSTSDIVVESDAIVHQCALPCFMSVSLSDVSELLSKMTIKSCPLDPVPASVLLKQCTSVLLPVMTQIVNQSLNLAVFPDCFKFALLNPLLKKPTLDVEALSNFRPISNLMFMSKLIEKVVASQLINHISSNGFDEILQSAYKQFHSTETALVKVFNDIVLDVDRNRTVILLLLDLSAAFDTVDHTILIEGLANRFGLCDLALAWFKSYLSDRTHFVSICGARSVTRPLSCGVPQGSVLGRTLYLLYTSPLGDIVRQYNMGYHFYADDTQLYLSFNSLSGDDQAYSVAQVESCIGDIDRWMSCTELLVISSKYRPRPSLDSILVGDHRVNRFDKAWNIGVVLDETLSLDNHVNSVCKSALFHLWNIAKIRMYLTSESTKTLVHAYVSCRLDNCDSLLLGSPKYMIQKLQRVQNCAARLVAGQPRATHICLVLKELHWKPIEQ